MDFQPADRDGAYAFVARTLSRLGYRSLDKPSKALVKRYLAKTTGYSRAQLTRLIRQHRETAKVVDRRDGNQGRPFARVYTPADVRLLAQVDEDLGQMSGLATRDVLHREHHLFDDVRFERLAGISASHIYNLRGSRTYRARRTAVEGTKATTVSVGERRAPQPDGMPGFLRVDTVHQGDRDGTKGVYLINLVDEVTQYEFVGAVAAISERFLVPVLDGLLGLFPFVVVGFHADNGSEYVNHTVAALLNKLHVRDFTKSRPRRSTDNALVEGKNASVVRRFLGHDHIPQRFAPRVDAFAQEHLSPYLNYHRPCLFATEHEGANGRIRRVYRAADVQTPYDKLRSLPGADACLRPGVSFPELDAQARAVSDLQAARALNAERARLFRTIADAWPDVA
ncbi:MAG: integrase [Gammaproteobacteria bacterium]|nr:integrase [Gammaproteobacteria bacterium]